MRKATGIVRGEEAELAIPEDRATEAHGGKEHSVADYLSNAILSGRYVPGQRLVEAELTGILGVSRSPVREAFRRLSAAGLLEIVPNRGAVVRRLSKVEALELFEIRTELEALAVRRASANMASLAVRDTFEAAILPIWDTATRHSTADYLRENQQFHAAVIAAAGNGQLIKLNQQLQLSLILAQMSGSLTSPVIAASLHEHRVIASAIRAGDASAADEAIREHLSRARAFLRAMPDDLFRRDD